MNRRLELLAVIGARGGSKSLPRKNIALLGGRPLIAWTIEAALAAGSVSRTIVTTDDPEIADVARRLGAEAPFLRPADLARDDTPGTAPVLHAVQWLDEHDRYRPDLVACLQPTSPLRTSADIDAAAELLVTRGADSVVSVTPAEQHPYWMKRVDADGWLREFMAQDTVVNLRQQLPPAFALNGAIYLARRQVLLATGGWYPEKTAGYVMPAERSVDIDTAQDFEWAATLLAKLG